MIGRKKTANLRYLVAMLAVLLIFAVLHTGNAKSQPSAPAPQVLFLGDRECGDIYSPCLFPHVVAHFRYLHVILHEYATDVEWRVRTSPDDCYYDAQDIGGYTPVPTGDFLESVIDLSATRNAQPPLNASVCYHFMGLHGYGAMYYAAYFDDNPFPDAHSIYPNYESMAGRPYLADLDVRFIHRSPSYPYDGSPNGPRIGSRVTYSAHVGNVGALPIASFKYAWLLDGKRLDGGTVSVPLSAGGSTVVSTSMRWDGRPHDLSFETSPRGPEISTSNDALSVRTDALSLGFWVEESAYRYFGDHQWEYCLERSCVGNDSFDDWLQRNMRYWNRMFARSRYLTLAPTGIMDRVRVDAVTIVPDGSLPLHGGLATNDPDTRDHSVDLEWGMRSAGAPEAYLTDREGPFNVDVGMLHELGHARSLTDVYRYDLPLDGPNVINVHAANGLPIFDVAQPADPGSKLRVFRAEGTDLMVYSNQEHDLMSCSCTAYYGPYNTLVLNRLRGRRARCGNTNPPCNIGDWFRDMPPVARLRVRDERGHPVARGTTVRLFFDSGRSYTGHTFEQTNSLTLTSGTNGVVDLPSDPFRTGGSVDRGAHNDLLVEVTTANRDIFCFQEPTTFNLAYWEGYRDAQHPAVFTLRLGRQINNGCELELPPARVDEPFATSPYRSTISVSSVNNHVWAVTIRLLDDASHAHPMRNRSLQIVDGSRLLAHRTTGPDGGVTLIVPARPHRLRVVDLTDNNLVITPQIATRPVTPGRSP